MKHLIYSSIKLQPSLKGIILAISSLVFFISIALASPAVEAPIEIQADEIWHDQAQNITSAIGSVEILQNNEKITADAIHVYRNSKQVLARGNVVLYREDGVFFADKMDITDNLTKGVAINFSARMKNGSLLAANSAQMLSKDVIKLHKAVFSPCKICADNFFANKPLWQVNAKEAKLDKNSQSIEYKHAYFSAFGKLPLFYTPYLSMPSPDVKRKSGLLRPTLGPKHTFGFIYKQPIYFNLLPNADATLTPVYTQKMGMIMEGEFRHLLTNGSYSIAGSITNPVLKDEKRKVWRGHIDSHGKFIIPERLNGGYFGYNLTKVIDKKKTYMKMYGYGEDDTLTSDIYYNNFNREDYFDIRAITFQGLRLSDQREQIPHIYPEINAEKVLRLNNSWKLRGSANLLNLKRKEGISYQRAISKLALENTAIIGNGHVLETKASLRGDVYQRQQWPQAKDTQTDHRFFPQLHTTWRYPLQKAINNLNILLEPITSLTISPQLNQSTIIPDEDNQKAELSANLLFYDNRFLGYDRISDGSWIDYGMRVNFNWPSNDIGLLFGQSYKLNHPKQVVNNSADNNSKFSDYLSSAYWRISPHLYFINRLRLDRKSLAIARNENNLYLEYKKWYANLDYTSFSKSIVSEDSLVSKNTLYKHELGIMAQYNFYQQWWIGANMRRKLGHKQRDLNTPNQRALLESGANLNYKGDCLTVSFSVKRNYTRFNDLTPGNTYSLSIDIPRF